MVRVQLQPLGNIAIVGPNVLGGQELSGLREKISLSVNHQQHIVTKCRIILDQVIFTTLRYHCSILFAHRMSYVRNMSSVDESLFNLFLEGGCRPI